MDENSERKPILARSGCMRRLLAAAVVALVAPVFVAAQANGASRERSFPGASTVIINAGSLNVRIEGHDTTRVTVREQDLPSAISVDYSFSRGTLDVRTGGEPTASPSTHGRPATLVFSMPRYEYVHVTTGDGDISIDNLSTQQLSLQSDSGGISVSDTNAALTANSASGNQSFDGVYGRIAATSKGGAITISGGVGVLNLKSDSGALGCKGFRVIAASHFETGSGAIRASFSNSLRELSFRLDSESGELAVGSVTGTKTLRWGSGGIPITATSTTGSLTFD